jgi:hypothetical protein
VKIIRMHSVRKTSNFLALNLVKHPVTTELSVTKLEVERRAADVTRSESIIPFHMLSLSKNDVNKGTEMFEIVCTCLIWHNLQPLLSRCAINPPLYDNLDMTLWPTSRNHKGGFSKCLHCTDIPHLTSTFE